MGNDPETMERAKVRFKAHMRFFRYAVALVLPLLAYGVGKATGQLEAINTACAAWIRAGPH